MSTPEERLARVKAGLAQNQLKADYSNQLLHKSRRVIASVDTVVPLLAASGVPYVHNNNEVVYMRPDTERDIQEEGLLVVSCEVFYAGQWRINGYFVGATIMHRCDVISGGIVHEDYTDLITGAPEETLSDRDRRLKELEGAVSTIIPVLFDIGTDRSISDLPVYYS